MIYQTIDLHEEGSLPGAKLVVYIQEPSESLDIDKRPLILVCPGGAYAYTSDREAEPMALAFLAMGYHAAILRYSCSPAKYPTALTEIARAMVILNEKAEEWHIEKGKIVVQGCSAGGHLAASLGVFWHKEFLAKQMGLKPSEQEVLRPFGMLLCYPVITSGEFAHRGSFENLLGEREKELAEEMSLETQVSEKTPKAFIWHTFEDNAVPVENSLMLVSALRKFEIPTEFHMYPVGSHGLALANRLTASAGGGSVQEECTSWIDLAKVWLDDLFAGKFDR